MVNRKIVTLISTFGGIGNLPFAPGTWASLISVPIAWLIIEELGNTALLILSFVVFMIGIWASGQFVQHEKVADPGSCVIDEVAGQFTVLSFFINEFSMMVCASLTFRFFDIVKIWPTSWVDKNIHGGFGIMLDDIIAAAQSILVLKVAVFLLF